MVLKLCDDSQSCMNTTVPYFIGYMAINAAYFFCFRLSAMLVCFETRANERQPVSKIEAKISNFFTPPVIFHVVLERGHSFLSLCHNPRVRQTDGRTDILLVARTALHSMQCVKNHTNQKLMRLRTICIMMNAIRRFQ